MAEVDGSIRVTTKIDLAGLKKGLAEMKKELEKAEKEYSDLEKRRYEQMDRYRKRIAKGGSDGAAAKAEMRRYEEMTGKQLDAAFAKVEKYRQKLAEANDYYQRFSGATEASNQVDQAMSADKFVSSITTQEKYNTLLAHTKAEMASIEAHAARISAQTGVTVNDILRQNDAYQEAAARAKLLSTRAKDISKNIRRAKNETKGLGDSTKKGIIGFGKMGLALMAVRFAMRAISAATREYMAVNSQLEGQMNTLKALWGQVLGPAIEWVINLLIRAISVVNAFVLALSGINLVARANAAALKKQNAAGGGGNKNQLAGFDEQTKLSDSGGGGGGENTATLPDGSTIDLSFLDPLLEAIRKFREDISPLITTVGNLFSWLWEEVLAPANDWALNSALPGFLNILGGAALVLNDALLAAKPILLWVWDNILKPIRDWSWGVFVDGLNAIGDWIHEHHETLGKIVGTIGGIIAACLIVKEVIGAISAVLAVLTNPVTLAVAAITALVAIFVTCYDKCEAFRKGMDKAASGVKSIWEGLVSLVKGLVALLRGDWEEAYDLLEEAEEKFIEGGKAILEGLSEGIKAGWEWCKEKISEIWEKIITKFKEKFGINSPSTLFADFGRYMMEGLVNGIKNAISKVTNACHEIWNTIKGVFSVVGTWFKDTFTQAWTNVKNVFSTGGQIFDGIKEGIESTFKTIVNGLITGINKIIRVPFNAINGMLNKIKMIKVLGAMPFYYLWDMNPLSVPQIPMLARGGIVNNPGKGVPAIIGEAGAEAVLPLENNTEWMDILADKIGGGTVTIPINLDGKRIATYVVDIQKKKAFATNGA